MVIIFYANPFTDPISHPAIKFRKNKLMPLITYLKVVLNIIGVSLINKVRFSGLV